MRDGAGCDLSGRNMLCPYSLLITQSVFVNRKMTLHAAPPDVKTSGSIVGKAH